VNHVTPIPASLDSRAAAPILCAGVTTYRALKASAAQHGEWIVIPGAGGGLGHLAVQYARVRGLRVIAIDTGADKHALCTKLGAEVWIDFQETSDIVGEVMKATDGTGAHFALVTAGTGAAYQQAVDYLRRNGTLLACGLPPKATLDASIYAIVVKVMALLVSVADLVLKPPQQGIKIIGSYIGNRQDAIEALDIAAQGHVVVHYQLKGLSELQTYAHSFSSRSPMINERYQSL
jgi:propanol-preferring alcohol dehydrogenase